MTTYQIRQLVLDTMRRVHADPDDVEGVLVDNLRDLTGKDTFDFLTESFLAFEGMLGASCQTLGVDLGEMLAGMEAPRG